LKIKYDAGLMKIMALFNTITEAQLKDSFIEGEVLYFIVDEHELGRALGKNGSKVKLLQHKLNRKIKIVEWNPDAKEFVKNLVYPSKVKMVEEKDRKLVIEALDHVSRGYIIGRAAQNLRSYEAIVKRYFNDIEEIRVL
jgi:transcription termination/antitermination protein NusA